MPCVKKPRSAEKGVELLLLLSLKKVWRTKIAHADDTDFFSNRQDLISKM